MATPSSDPVHKEGVATEGHPYNDFKFGYFLYLPLGNVTHGGVGFVVNSELSNKFGEPVPSLLR